MYSDPLFFTHFAIINSNRAIRLQRGYCLSMVDGRCNWPRGKALGGTSVINFMIYTRGARADYEEWRALGNPGWGYDEVLPYFLKSENSR